MANYPDIPIGWDSEIEPVQNLITDITQGGGVRQRRLYSGPTLYRITVEHPLMSAGETDELVAFFEANHDSEFLFLWPLDYSGSPHNYAARFIERPIPAKSSPAYSSATVRLIGTRT